MHAKPRILLNPHRRARLIAWTLAMLAWVHAVFFRDRIMSRRQLRKRGGFLSLDHIARVVVQLIVLRAAELARLYRRGNISFHKHGVDLRPRHLRRSAIGSRIRRALKHRDIGERIARLTTAINALDLWAAHFAKRLRRRFTKLSAILTRAGVTEPLTAVAVFALGAADTS